MSIKNDDNKRAEFLNRMQEYRKNQDSKRIMGNQKQVNTIEYIENYIKELESRNADIEQINRWKKLKKNMEEKSDRKEIGIQGNKDNIPSRDMNKTSTDFITTVESTRRSVSNTRTGTELRRVTQYIENQQEDERTAFLKRMQDYQKSEKMSIKVEEEIMEEPIKEKRTLKNKVARLLIMGTLIGPPAVLAYNWGYDYGVNMPSPHNYTTVKEVREGKKHDPTNCIRYWEEKGLSREEINKILEEYGDAR